MLLQLDSFWFIVTTGLGQNLPRIFILLFLVYSLWLHQPDSIQQCISSSNKYIFPWCKRLRAIIASSSISMDDFTRPLGHVSTKFDHNEVIRSASLRTLFISWEMACWSNSTLLEIFVRRSARLYCVPMWRWTRRCRNLCLECFLIVIGIVTRGLRIGCVRPLDKVHKPLKVEFARPDLPLKIFITRQQLCQACVVFRERIL